VTRPASGPPGEPVSGPGVIAIFGPTAVGKTAVAIELARLIREAGGTAVAVNCDSIQVYRGLELISGAADRQEREQLEHRLLSFVPIDEEFSAGRYSKLAHREIDGLLEQGVWPILVGGTGLYLRGALTDMEFRPPVSDEVRAEVEAEIEKRGAAAVHADLPPERRGQIHANDRSRVARAAELVRSGQQPAPDHAGGGNLWTAGLRRPSSLIGLVEDGEALRERIGRRVASMAVAGAGAEARRAVEAGASRTAGAAIGFEEFLAGDLELAAVRHRRYAKRQMTWMRRMEGVEIIERSGMDDQQVAESILALACGRFGDSST
jgi:tRNA dimethylallyltransferase